MTRPLHRRLLESVLGEQAYRRLVGAYVRARRPSSVRHVRKTRAPLSENWGSERGTPIDRYYIERFLEEHRADITGVCLELNDRGYTERFGHGITRSEILDIRPENEQATIHGDLRRLDAVADETFDCIVLTQVLHFVDDLDAAVAECHRILKPGGVVLATMPSTVARLATNYEDYWRFTPLSARYLFEKRFPPESITVGAYGNIVSGLAFWLGKAQEELSRDERDFSDGRHLVTVAVRAVKPPSR